MLKTEPHLIINDHVILKRIYSDRGVFIQRDGANYVDAVDPAESDRQYIETDELIPMDDPVPAAELP